MTHFPQPHPTKRAARVQLGGSVLAAVRFDDGQRSRAKLYSISVTGGLLKLAKPLSQGDFVEIGFQTKVGAVIGMAEMLSPTRKATDGTLQPFRFIAQGDAVGGRSELPRDKRGAELAAEVDVLGLRLRPFRRSGAAPRECALSLYWCRGKHGHDTRRDHPLGGGDHRFRAQAS